MLSKSGKVVSDKLIYISATSSSLSRDCVTRTGKTWVKIAEKF